MLQVLFAQVGCPSIVNLNFQLL